MNGSAQPLVKFLDGAGKRFIIPVYQRNYDWKIDNCKQLLDDLIRVINEHRESHFFGSIVSVANVHGATSELLIIDGQQRITTISLLFLAMVNLMDEGILKATDPVLLQRIKMTYLVDQFAPDERKIKLKPIKDDSDAFEKLFKTPDEYNKASVVTRNYNYFYDRLKAESKISPDELFNAICSLVIIDISLDPYKDDAQLIFESLNSTGLDLSEGDKIRNYVLMGQDADTQEQLYYTYWNNIEKNTDFSVSDFIRHYLTGVLSRTPAMNDVYNCFKSYVESNHIDKQDLLKVLTEYSEYYKEITTASSSSEKVNTVLKRLNILDMSVSYPFLLQLWSYKNSNSLSEDDLTDVLFSLEVYIFRRLICGVPTNALNKIFTLLHRDCLKYVNDNNSYVDVFKYVLTSKGASGRFPKDTEFFTCFEEKDIYNMRGKNKMYLFDRLENKDTYERTNVISLMQDGVYTIEHIMPRTLTDWWKQHLGDNYNEIYDVWINRIANLTLTGYNSQYSNRKFDEKRDMKDGFKDSHLQLNAYVSSCNKWTLDELKHRNIEMRDLAKKLWPYPQTDFKPPVALNEAHSLDEDFNFKGRSIVSFSFLNTPYSASSWVEMFVQVVKFLFELDATVIYKLVEETDGLGADFVSKETDGYSKVANGVYLWTSSNTMTKIRILRQIFERYEFDPSELVIEIEAINDENAE